MQMEKRPKIKITIIDRKGPKGCHRGHKVGDTFDFDTERGKICPMAMHVLFPEIDILRYVLEYVDFSNEIADGRVYITTEKPCALNFITEKYLSDDNLIFLYPQAYAQLLTQEMIDLTDDIVQVCNLKKMDVNTITMLAKNIAFRAFNHLESKKTQFSSVLYNFCKCFSTTLSVPSFSFPPDVRCAFGIVNI